MNTNVFDRLLSGIDRTTNRVGPFSGMVDRLVARLMPGLQAAACDSSKPLCWEGCSSTHYCQCDPCENGQQTCYYAYMVSRMCGYPYSTLCYEMPTHTHTCGSTVVAC